MNKNSNIALLILSCDNYSDLWPIFIKQFKKYWPDCPYDKYISTNYLSANSKTFTDIKIGNDKSWSDGVLKALNKIKDKYEYAFISLEDLILMGKVDNADFSRITSEFIKVDGNYLKFIRKPKPTKKFNSLFGEIEPGSLYRPTCVYALWKIDILLDLLVESESAWEFERLGSLRSDKYKRFFVVYKDFFKISNTIVKGKWVPKEKRKIEKLGYTIAESRNIISIKESLKLKISAYLFNLFTSYFPWKYRRNIIFKLKKNKLTLFKNPLS